MKTCTVCKVFIATRFFKAEPVCHTCFMRIDARALAEAAKVDVELAYLEAMWKRSQSNHVGC